MNRKVNVAVVKGQFVRSLASAAATAKEAAKAVPALVRVVIEDDQWRSFVSEISGLKIQYDTFEEFVTDRKFGLGTTIQDLLDMCRHEPDLQELILEAMLY